MSIKDIERNDMRRRKRRPASIDHVERRRIRRRKKTGFRIFFLIFIIIVIGITLMGTVFASAKISIELKEQTASLDEVSLEASRAPLRNGDIVYEVLGPYTKEGTAQLEAIRREKTATVSEGTVTIYNPAKKRLDLVGRTRLQTSDGKLYRLRGPSSVPAAIESSDGTVTEGQREVIIFSDQEGEEFNLTKSDVRFTVPGLFNSATYKGVYAVSKTPIIGGFDGERLIADEDEQEKAFETLRTNLESELLTELTKIIDERDSVSHVIFDNGIFIEFEELPREQDGDTITIKQRARLRAITFRESSLSELFYKKAVNSLVDLPPTSIEKDKLIFNIVDRDDFDIVEDTSFEFNLEGESLLRWGIDEALLKNDIQGKKANEARNTITDNYKQIQTINDVRIIPFWRRSIPSNKAKIEVEIEYPVEDDIISKFETDL